LTITNTKYGIIGKENIKIEQSSKDFGKTNQYTLRFTPKNPLPQISWIKIIYPVTVGINPNE